MTITATVWSFKSVNADNTSPVHPNNGRQTAGEQPLQNIKNSDLSFVSKTQENNSDSTTHDKKNQNQNSPLSSSSVNSVTNYNSDNSVQVINPQPNQPTPVSLAPVQAKLVVNSISPTQGQVGTSVEILGTGFTNVTWVNFGYGVIPPSNFKIVSDQEIIFRVPEILSFRCQFSNPHCMIMSAPLQNGTYNVSVSTNSITSNYLAFTVLGNITKLAR